MVVGAAPQRAALKHPSAARVSEGGKWLATLIRSNLRKDRFWHSSEVASWSAHEAVSGPSFHLLFITLGPEAALPSVSESYGMALHLG
jgi:hypothetical protein